VLHLCLLAPVVGAKPHKINASFLQSLQRDSYHVLPRGHTSGQRLSLAAQPEPHQLSGIGRGLLDEVLADILSDRISDVLDNRLGAAQYGRVPIAGAVHTIPRMFTSRCYLQSAARAEALMTKRRILPDSPDNPL